MRSKILEQKDETDVNQIEMYNMDSFYVGLAILIVSSFALIYGQFMHNSFFIMFCGRDKKLSIRRVFAGIIMGAYIHSHVMRVLTGIDVQEAFIWADVTLITALLALATSDSITQSIRDYKNNKNKNEDIETP